MKLTKSVLTAFAIGVVSVGFAQDDVVPDERDPRFPRLRQHLERIGDDLPEEAAGQLEDFKAANKELREILKNDYLAPLGDDPSDEAKEAAIEAFRAEYADQIQINKDLGREVFELVRDNRPERPIMPPEIEGIRELIEQHKATKARLKAELRSRLAELPDDATRDEAKEVINAFHEEFADVIAENKELGQRIRELIKEHKEDNGWTVGSIDEEALSPEFAAQREEFRQERLRLMEAHRQAVQDLEGLSPEERREALRELREDSREDYLDLKERRRELIRDRLDEATEDQDRRPDA